MRVWETTKEKPQGVVVIVHGNGEHINRYEWLREQWLQSGFHIVMGDLPGHGEDPTTRGHINGFYEFIDVIESWVKEAMSFNLPIFILGHSLGGLSTIRALQERPLPVHGVLLSSPCLGLSIRIPKWLRLSAVVLNHTFPSFLVPTKKSADNKNATRNLDILKKDAIDPLILKKISVRWYFEMEAAMGHAFQKKEDFPDIPLLILQAGEDKIVDKLSVKTWFDSLIIKEKTYVEWPGLYHEVFNEPEREDVFQCALTFITTHLHSGGRLK